MASLLKAGEAKNYAPMIAALREHATVDGKPVERWYQSTSEDGLHLFIHVTYAPLQAGMVSISETTKFPALAVAALEGK
jgi:hypothetical protein